MSFNSFSLLIMTNQIITEGKTISLSQMPGTTVLRANAPLKCSICGKYRPFFYNIQIHSGEPAMLICVAKCHRHLQKQLMSHVEDHFFVRGIAAPIKGSSHISSKFYIYCRAATSRVTHPSHSLDGQKESLISFAQKNEFIVAQVFQESSSAMAHRPLFLQMLQGIERGEADGILVQDISRLVRSNADGKRLIDMLDRGLIKLIQTPERTFNKNSLIWHLSLQEQERNALSHSIKRGLQMRKSRDNLR